ncbi:helix-turn-helix domain-containing protein [Noviherbaspirillum sedimenti]|uniref:Helix-turn-helix domain-containing protein n=1 Tax=Noviherbaspirillum sedimenti TaxID=2320865 RepID=A0A3A3G1X8_9BURK|nr:helix-turn-helix domain-containing protein [Noviherbaspirillum sedimenti]RJG00482.1 helix-turn-helix domain-containing protein [Noviherbaspirillum sedimenti]
MSDAGMEGRDQEAPLSPAPEAAMPGPGAQLAAQRQALGWTVEQVANQLNLAPRQVQAMEDDNFAALPGMVIARGFVRAYAKLLRLEPAPLLALIAEKPAPGTESLDVRRTRSATFTESNLPATKRPGGGTKWLAAILLLLVLAALGWLAVRDGWIAGLPGGQMAPARTGMQPEPLAPDAASGVPLGQAAEDVPAPTTEAPAQLPATPAAPTAPVTSAATNALPPTPAAPSTPAAQSTPAVADKLVLTVRAASWIELKRADGVSLAARLLPAGTTESFDVAQGASLVVGNAAGVDVTYRGQALNLNADTKNNVARVTLK